MSSTTHSSPLSAYMRGRTIQGVLDEARQLSQDELTTKRLASDDVRVGTALIVGSHDPEPSTGSKDFAGGPQWRQAFDLYFPDGSQTKYIDYFPEPQGHSKILDACVAEYGGKPSLVNAIPCVYAGRPLLTDSKNAIKEIRATTSDYKIGIVRKSPVNPDNIGNSVIDINAPAMPGLFTLLILVFVQLQSSFGILKATFTAQAERDKKVWHRAGPLFLNKLRTKKRIVRTLLTKTAARVAQAAPDIMEHTKDFSDLVTQWKNTADGECATFSNILDKLGIADKPQATAAAAAAAGGSIAANQAANQAQAVNQAQMQVLDSLVQWVPQGVRTTASAGRPATFKTKMELLGAAVWPSKSAELFLAELESKMSDGRYQKLDDANEARWHNAIALRAIQHRHYDEHLAADMNKFRGLQADGTKAVEDIGATIVGFISYVIEQRENEEESRIDAPSQAQFNNIEYEVMALLTPSLDDELRNAATSLGF